MRSGWPDDDLELQPRVFSHLEKGPYGLGCERNRLKRNRGLYLPSLLVP